MKKFFKYLIIVVSLILLIGCTSPKEQYVITIEYNNGEINNEILWTEGTNLEIYETVEYIGYDFVGWYLDEELTIPLGKNYKVESNITVYAKWEVAKHTVSLYSDGKIFKEIEVEHNKTLDANLIPEKEGYSFSYWSYKEDGSERFSIYNKVTSDIVLYAQYQLTEFEVTCILKDAEYDSKDDLYNSFFTDFYNFLLNNTDINFEKLNITNLDDFLLVCKDWNAYNKNSFYGIGDQFSKYFLTIEVGGKLENQPDTTFIGYCYKNNMYKDFIPFLMTFFAYWRTDEGYTGSSSDPSNTGNDFFASSWASLVDTCKFFYFTSANLNDTYPWFNSQRVKDALDNIPGVNDGVLKYYGNIENPVVLETPSREGYEFIGWYNENNEKIEIVYNEQILYAMWKKIE